MNDILYIDLETQSMCDLKKRGPYHYNRHPSTRFLCMAWAPNDEPVELWLPGDPIPDQVAWHMAQGGQVWAHNAVFERLAINYAGQRYGFPKLKIEQMVCTLVQCANMALPLSLENAAAALCLPQRKDMEKRKSMLKISKPISVDPCTGEPVFATPESHPKEFEDTYNYCKGDVEVERAIAKQVRMLSPFERKVYIMDQSINDRGVKVDIPTVHIMKRLAAAEQERLNGELEPLCGLKFTQVAKIGAWVKARGIPVPSLDKHEIGVLLKRTDLPADVRRVIEIRQEAAKSSVAKLQAMLDRCEDDHRGRGCLQMGGAVSTLRWSGRAIQTQNLPRPETTPELIETILDWLSTRPPEEDEYTLDVIRTIWGRPMSIFSDCLRGLLVADEGKVLIGPDLVSIESMVGAWLVGDDAKVAFMAAGGDVYKEIARLILGLAPFRGWALENGVPVEGVPVTKLQRQLYGKVPELSLGYQGGYKEDGAIGKFCEAGGLPYPGEKEAQRWQEVWRAIHPRHVKYWEDINQAAIGAVLSPGSKTAMGPEGRRVSFKMEGRFLLCRLPSDSVLCYPFPRIEQGRFGREALTYMKAKDKQWYRNHYFGGHGLENVDQRCSRDLLAVGMLNLEEADYPIVTHSHDEAVVETEERPGVEAEVMRIFNQRPAWAATLPYTSSAFTARRYRK